MLLQHSSLPATYSSDHRMYQKSAYLRARTLRPIVLAQQVIPGNNFESGLKRRVSLPTFEEYRTTNNLELYDILCPEYLVFYNHR